MDYKALAERLLPGEYPSPEFYEEKYPPRDLPKGAEVTRLAPSPTGFIHLGNLFVAIANERIAHRSGGVLYLRIEDTDLKRKVDGAVEAVIKALDYFDIKFDEGAEIGGDETYAPWYQRQRAEIYRAFAKKLIEEGRAYPCFCTEEELSALRAEQQKKKEITGYYGKYAKCRNLTEEEIYANLDAGKPFVIRFRSLGNPENKIKLRDAVKGEITVTENDQDVVILKSDGIPTYHFAHAIDDHFMRTTLVIRGEEWLASLPIHLELFDALGFPRPRYGHNCSLMKQDGETRRKLSKRKDPELALEFYRREGYYPRAVKIYMLTLLNSNFEEWYLKNPEADLNEFPFKVEKMSRSGALFDLDKLNDISKNELSKLSEEEMCAFLKAWAEEFGGENYRSWFSDGEKMLRALALCMGVGGKKRRKDFTTAAQAMELLEYFFRRPVTFEPYRVDGETKKAVLSAFLKGYSHSDDAQAWFAKVKTIAAENGFAAETKEYRANPEAYRGSVADVAEVLRIATTGKANTPDLWTIMQILGEEEVHARLESEIERREVTFDDIFNGDKEKGMSRADVIFIENCRDILQNGFWDTALDVRPRWDDGTPAHTVKKFGIVNRYNLQEEFPILTLRRTAFKSCIDEILWIWQKKSNNIGDLNSHIWDSWADQNGSIGKAYGYQLGVKYKFREGEFDQVDRVLYDLKHNPASRRILTSIYNFADLHEMNLYPCAYSMTFNVSGDTLNGILNQRSQDMLTANNWNVVQYAVLLIMFAQASGLKAGELVHVIADAHLYDRHIPIVEEVIARAPKPAPKLVVDPDIKNFYDFTVDSFKLENYEYYPLDKKIPVAV